MTTQDIKANNLRTFEPETEVVGQETYTSTKREREQDLFGELSCIELQQKLWYATYTNKVTGERARREVSDIGAAWELADEVCEDMDWNIDMFAQDVEVRILK